MIAVVLDPSVALMGMKPGVFECRSKKEAHELLKRLKAESDKLTRKREDLTTERERESRANVERYQAK